MCLSIDGLNSQSLKNSFLEIKKPFHILRYLFTSLINIDATYQSRNILTSVAYNVHEQSFRQ